MRWVQLKSKREKVQDFVTYAVPFLSDDEKAFVKLHHSILTADNCEKIAKGLSLNSYDIELAWFIGLLHDIGRFAQLDTTKTFKDSDSFDHGVYAETQLRKGLLDQFATGFVEIEDYETVYQAIGQHNKLSVRDDLSAREKLFCHIVRDADVIDIFRQLASYKVYIDGSQEMEEVRRSDINDAVLQSFLRNQLVKHEDVKSKADCFLQWYAFVFGLHFTQSVKMVQADGYLRQMLQFRFLDGENIRKFEIVKCKVEEFLTNHSC